VRVNGRGALVAGATSGAIVLGGAAAFAARNPLYGLEVFRGQLVQASPSFPWFRTQAADFALLGCGLLAAIFVPFAARLWQRGPGAPADAGADFWRWQTLLATGGLLAGLGWHTGAYLTYFLHLLLVPLVMLAGGSIARADSSLPGWSDLALTANLVVLFALAPGWPREDAAWTELRQDILREPGRVAVDYLMEPIAREKGGVTVVSTGQSGYVVKEPFRMPGGSPAVVRARAAATEFLAAQSRGLFDEHPADTIYLDCTVDLAAGSGSIGGRFAVVPRNELPAFIGPAMNAYVATKVFHITPYYFATNAPRAAAGVARTTIVKFVRKR